MFIILPLGALLVLGLGVIVVVAVLGYGGKTLVQDGRTRRKEHKPLDWDRIDARMPGFREMAQKSLDQKP